MTTTKPNVSKFLGASYERPVKGGFFTVASYCDRTDTFYVTGVSKNGKRTTSSMPRLTLVSGVLCNRYVEIAPQKG